MPATYSPATIQRCNTILQRAAQQAIAQRQPARKPRKPDTTIARTIDATVRTIAAEPVKRDWRKRQPSKSQQERNNTMLRRINVMEVALGYKRSTHAIANGGKPCKFTAGAYSDHLQQNLKPLFDSLAAELAA